MAEKYIGPTQRELITKSRPDTPGVTFNDIKRGYEASQNLIYSPELAKKYLELGNLVSEKIQKGNLEQTNPPHADIAKTYKDQYKGFNDNQSVYIYLRNPKSEEQVEKIKLDTEDSSAGEVKITGKVWLIDKDSKGKEKARCYYLGEGGHWYLQEADEKKYNQETDTTEWKMKNTSVVTEQEMTEVLKIFDTLKPQHTKSV